MLDDASRPFSREELLEGLPNRRASLLLFSIEGQTAYLVAQARQAMADFLPPGTAEEREQAFLEALARRRELPLRPTIQDLERYAPHWAALVPANPRLRAALGLDDEAVQRAYLQLYRQPLEGIFAARVPWAERLRWLRAGLAGRLERRPPVWAAFALKL